MPNKPQRNVTRTTLKDMPHSLRTIFLGFLIILSLILLSCSRRSNQASTRSGNASTHNTPFDTLSILKRLSLSGDDSLALHVDRTDTLERYLDINDTSIVRISGDSLLYVIRTFTNQFVMDSQVSKFFSSVILYSRAIPQAEVCRLHQDSIEVFCGSLSSYEPSVRFLDINYDGYQDILLSFTTNTTGRSGYNYFFVFNPKTCRFDADTALYSLFHELEIYVDTDDREISEGGRIGLDRYGGSEYRWNGGTYELHAQISVDDNEDGTALVNTRRELLNGTWVLVGSDTIRIR